MKCKNPGTLQRSQHIWTPPCGRVVPRLTQLSRYWIFKYVFNNETRVRAWATFYVLSKHRPSGPMLSISRNVRPCVCLSVCLFVCSLLRYHLNVFLSPLPEVKSPIFLEIQNPWGKVMERSGLRFEFFY